MLGGPHHTECGRVSEEGPRPQGARGNCDPEADRLTWPEMRCLNTWPPQKNMCDVFSTLKTRHGGTKIGGWGGSIVGRVFGTCEGCAYF